MDSVQETEKRQKYAYKVLPYLKNFKAVMIIGSVAYGGNYSVKKDSDIEILSIVNNDELEYLCHLNETLLQKVLPKEAIDYFRNNDIEICHATLKKDFPVDFIFWSDNFFNEITKTLTKSHAKRFVENIRSQNVILHNFDGDPIKYEYSPIDVKGGRILDYPVHIFDNEEYWAGVPVENLLSEPIIISGDSFYINNKINSLIRLLLKKAGKKDIRNLLLKKDNFSPQTNMKLEERVKNIKNQIKQS